jgi:four helix bundle protein
MRFKRFEEIESWKIARELTKAIYEITKLSNFSKDYGLKDQIQRASVSIMANIAEGFDSGTDKLFVNFLNYAYRSASEVQSLLYVAKDQLYINEKDFERLFTSAQDIKNLIGGLIQYLNKRKN